jgi:hypothetical protein
MVFGRALTIGRPPAEVGIVVGESDFYQPFDIRGFMKSSGKKRAPSFRMAYS